MSSEAPPAANGPVVLRVKLRYADLPTFIAKFAVNVGRGGMFLPSRSLQPVGTEVRFELRLADDQVVLSGMGRVAAVVEPAEDAPDVVPGMAIEFLRMTRESRDLVMRVLEVRREQGLGEPVLPAPEASASMAARDSSEAMPAPPSASLPAMPAPLSPEPARAPRRSLAELMASLPAPAPSEDPLLPLASDELGAAVDLERTRARVRSLIARDPDDELAALLQPPVTAPVEITASAAAIARELGLAAPSPRRASSARGSEPPTDSAATARAAPTAATGAPASTGAGVMAARSAGDESQPAPRTPEDREPAAAATPRRARVTRPPRLTNPTGVFSRPRPQPERAAAEVVAELPEQVPPPERASVSAFERVLAELEEAEISALAEPSLGAARTPPPAADPLDRLALDDLDDSVDLAGPTVVPAPFEPVRARRASSAEVLDLGDLGESAFEILDEEELDERVTAPRDAVAPRAATNPGADVVDAPSASGSGTSIPTWRRTTGFDPLDAAPDTARLAELAPPTIPGRIPTREIDLESALAALDLGAEDVPPARAEEPPADEPVGAATTPSSDAPAAAVSTSPLDDGLEIDEIPLELEFDD